jgi:hypothetical protein
MQLLLGWCILESQQELPPSSQTTSNVAKAGFNLLRSHVLYHSCALDSVESTCPRVLINEVPRRITLKGMVLAMQCTRNLD